MFGSVSIERKGNERTIVMNLSGKSRRITITGENLRKMQDYANERKAERSITEKGKNRDKTAVFFSHSVKRDIKKQVKKINRIVKRIKFYNFLGTQHDLYSTFSRIAKDKLREAINNLNSILNNFTDARVTEEDVLNDNSLNQNPNPNVDSDSFAEPISPQNMATKNVPEQSENTNTQSALETAKEKLLDQAAFISGNSLCTVTVDMEKYQTIVQEISVNLPEGEKAAFEAFADGRKKYLSAMNDSNLFENIISDKNSKSYSKEDAEKYLSEKELVNFDKDTLRIIDNANDNKLMYQMLQKKMNTLSEENESLKQQLEELQKQQSIGVEKRSPSSTDTEEPTSIDDVNIESDENKTNLEESDPYENAHIDEYGNGIKKGGRAR